MIAVNADGTLDLKYLPSYLQKTAGKNTGRRRAAATEFSSVLDDGEIERGVSADLVRLYPETPRTPREDVHQRLVNHLQKVLRISAERPVALQHHRRFFLPKLPSTRPPIRASSVKGAKALLWMGCERPPTLGLYDLGKVDGPLYEGRYEGLGDEI